MQIPKIISKEGHEYIIVKKCNDKLFLYKDMINGFTTCFDLYDLGLIKPVVVKPKVLAHHKVVGGANEQSRKKKKSQRI